MRKTKKRDTTTSRRSRSLPTKVLISLESVEDRGRERQRGRHRGRQRQRQHFSTYSPQSTRAIHTTRHDTQHDTTHNTTRHTTRHDTQQTWRHTCQPQEGHNAPNVRTNSTNHFHKAHDFFACDILRSNDGERNNSLTSEWKAWSREKEWRTSEVSITRE